MKITVKLHNNSYKAISSKGLPLFKINKFFHKLVIKNNDNEIVAYINPFIDTLTEGYVLTIYPKSKINNKVISIATSLSDKNKYIITDLHYHCETIIPQSQWVITDNNIKIDLSYKDKVLDITIDENTQVNTLEVLGISLGIILNEKSLGKINF